MTGPLLTADEAAEYCRCSLTYFKRHYVARDFPRVHVGGWRYRKEDLDAWLMSRTVGSFDGAARSRTSGSRTTADGIRTRRAREILERLETRQRGSTPMLSVVRGGR